VRFSGCTDIHYSGTIGVSIDRVGDKPLDKIVDVVVQLLAQIVLIGVM
jgi:hypothetical protein